MRDALPALTAGADTLEEGRSVIQKGGRNNSLEITLQNFVFYICFTVSSTFPGCN